METKNIIINNYVSSAMSIMSNISAALAGLSDNDETNSGIIKTADILITALNSQIVVLQNELDNYGG